MHCIFKFILLLIVAVALSGAAAPSSTSTNIITTDVPTPTLPNLIVTTTTLDVIKATDTPSGNETACNCGLFVRSTPVFWGGKRICINEANSSLCALPSSAGAALKAPNMLVLLLVMLGTTVLASGGMCHAPVHLAYAPRPTDKSSVAAAEKPAPSSTFVTVVRQKDPVMAAKNVEITTDTPNLSLSTVGAATRSLTPSTTTVAAGESTASDFAENDGIMDQVSGALGMGEGALRFATSVVHKVADEADKIVSDAVKEGRDNVDGEEERQAVEWKGTVLQHFIDMAEEGTVDGLEDLADFIRGKVLELL